MIDWRHARIRWPIVVAALLVASLRGGTPDVTEIVRIHIAALGGEERIQQLKAFKGTGQVTTGGQRLAFSIVAARPNRLRMDYEYPNGHLVQAYDGTHPPWELDTRVMPARSRQLGRAAAEAFVAGADFDDALLVAKRQSETIEFAGTTIIDNRTLVRLLVTQRLSKSFFLLLDADTYLIVSRVDPKPVATTNGAEVITEYRNYWPVGGVLAAHAVTVWTNGDLTEEAVLDKTEANPVLPADIFSQPSMR